MSVDGQTAQEIEAQDTLDAEQAQIHSEELNAEYTAMRKEREAYEEEQSWRARESRLHDYYRC